MVIKKDHEMSEIDENYLEDLWFAEIDEKVFSFKDKAHNWWKEGENDGKKEKGSKSSDSASKLSCSRGSSGSISSKIWAKNKVM